MRIEVIGDDSIGPQARAYAEYRLFTALSRVVDASRVRSASLLLHRATSTGPGEGVVCTVNVELDEGEVIRLGASGDHPYAAINRAVHRLHDLPPSPPRDQVERCCHAASHLLDAQDRLERLSSTDKPDCARGRPR